MATIYHNFVYFQVPVEATAEQSSDAWDTLMGSFGMGESPHSHILFSLHKNDPSILDI